MGNKGSASSSYHKSVRFTIGNSRVVPNAGLLIASGMLEECSFDDALSRFTRKTQKYSSADIMKAMLASISKISVSWRRILLFIWMLST